MAATENEVTADVLAKLFNMTPRRVHQLVKEGVIPKVGRGKYPLATSIRSYVGHLQGLAASTGTSNDAPDLLRERTRKERANADKTEFDLAIQRKEYVHVSHVERILERFASQAAAVFDSVTAKIKNRLPHLSQRDIDVVRKDLAGTRNAVADLRPSTDSRATRAA